MSTVVIASYSDLLQCARRNQISVVLIHVAAATLTVDPLVLARVGTGFIRLPLKAETEKK